MNKSTDILFGVAVMLRDDSQPFCRLFGKQKRLRKTTQSEEQTETRNRGLH